MRNLHLVLKAPAWIKPLVAALAGGSQILWDGEHFDLHPRPTRPVDRDAIARAILTGQLRTEPPRIRDSSNPIAEWNTEPDTWARTCTVCRWPLHSALAAAIHPTCNDEEAH